MIQNHIAEDRQSIWEKFHSPQIDESTGLDNATLIAGAAAFFDAKGEAPMPVIKAQAFSYLTQNLRIELRPTDLFPVFGCWDRKARPLAGLLQKGAAAVSGKMQNRTLWQQLGNSGATRIWIDFDHSAPDWERIMRLGFPGILESAREWRQKHAPLTPAQTAYFDGIEITYAAILEMIQRFIDYGIHHGQKEEKIALQVDCLKSLLRGAPSNTYEALLLIYLYFFISEHIDHMQVRTLGNLDNLLLPFVENDMRDNRFSEADIRTLFDYFLMQFGGINNYWGHPFYLGGTDRDGNSRINPLSYLILEEFDKLSIPTPKIQLKIARNTPDHFIAVALQMIRKGNSSLVFISEENICRTMLAHGGTAENARTCNITGCYEMATVGRYHSNGTGCGHINMLKPFEWIFNGGADKSTGQSMGVPVKIEDLDTFDDFYLAYIAQLKWIANANIQVVNDFEQYLHEINPSNMLSGVIEHSLKVARDAFHNGCYYNVTGLLNAGFASAVDALTAIREFVYEKKEITLEELGNILRDNWSGQEKLRQKILRSPNKFGNGIDRVDCLATMIGDTLNNIISGRPNARGGVWKFSGHSAKQYFELGKITEATPDGRLAGEEMSKNLSPAMGMDRNGITALLKSISRLKVSSFPGDFPLDAMLHPSSVSGSEGIAAWRTLLRKYLEYGLAIHFNIFDAGILKEAQQKPEKYEGLQVRVCGWNTHFTQMAKVEQDLFIRRAENVLD